jgi:hypothetical protein
MKKIKTILYFSFFFFIFGSPIQAQFLDSMRIWEPLGETILSNVLINRFNYNIRNEAWANVNFNTWKANFKDGFGSDGDRFDTNFFGHPFHGSIYYNSSRSFGNTFWQSVPFVIVGSLSWEYLGENEVPSEIDFHTTTMGGIFLGECTHRITKYLLQPNRGAKSKLLKNTYLTILNPAGQLNRWLSKSVRRDFGRSERSFPIIGELTLGGALPMNKYNEEEFPQFVHLQYYLRHGNLFSHKGSYKPFDHFVAQAWIDIPLEDIEEPFYFNISGIAPLFRRKLSTNTIFTVSQHYDYINNQAFKIGTLGLTADLSFNLSNENNQFGLAFNSGFLPFGGVGSEVAEILSEGEFFTRDYMYGRGYMTKIRIHHQWRKWIRFTGNFNRWVIFPIITAKGKEVSHLIQIDAMIPLTNKLNIGGQYYRYSRNATYPDIPQFNNINHRYNELRMVASYTFY